MPKFNVKARFPTFLDDKNEECAHTLTLEIDAYNEIAAARMFFKMGVLPVENGYLNTNSAVHVEVIRQAKRAVPLDEDEDIPSIHV